MRGVPFQSTSKFRFLGVTLDDDLKLKEHTIITHKKISIAVGAVKSIRNSINDNIDGILSYCIIHSSYFIIHLCSPI